MSHATVLTAAASVASTVYGPSQTPYTPHPTQTDVGPRGERRVGHDELAGELAAVPRTSTGLMARSALTPTFDTPPESPLSPAPESSLSSRPQVVIPPSPPHSSSPPRSTGVRVIYPSPNTSHTSPLDTTTLKRDLSPPTWPRTSPDVQPASSAPASSPYQRRSGSISSPSGIVSPAPVPLSPTISVSVLPNRFPELDFTCPSPHASTPTLDEEERAHAAGEDPVKVEVMDATYELSCKLVGFLLDNITLANKNDGILMLCAARWTSSGETQVNRCVSFPPDAALNKAKARFNGDILHISIPRASDPFSFIPVSPLGSAAPASCVSALRRSSQS